MRNLWDVVEQIKVVVPDDFEDRGDLFAALNSIVDSAKYSAPEIIGTRWHEAALALGSYLGSPDEDWKKEIQAIFAGKKEEAAHAG